MRIEQLFTYTISGEGINCRAQIYIANNYICTIRLGTKYKDCAELELSEIIGKEFKKLFKDNLIDEITED